MRQITVLLYPGYSVMALAAISVFETANMLAPEPVYHLSFVSEEGGQLATSVGMGVHATQFDAPDSTARTTGGDTLIVGGGNIPKPIPQGLLDYLQTAPGRFRRIASICTGAFILAEAGLLNGRRVTTHWSDAQSLQSRFPEVTVDSDRIFVQDGPIWTSAGMSAGVDLALKLVEDDCGPDLTKAVARKLVLYHRRGGGQSQFSSLLELSPKSDRIQRALTFARDNLHRPLTVPDLAAAAHLSPRQFSRSFQAETGQTPAKAIENLRVEAARSLLEESRHSITEVAEQTGFSDRDQMRRAFLRAFGQSPQALRRI